MGNLASLLNYPLTSHPSVLPWTLAFRLRTALRFEFVGRSARMLDRMRDTHMFIKAYTNELLKLYNISPSLSTHLTACAQICRWLSLSLSVSLSLSLSLQVVQMASYHTVTSHTYTHAYSDHMS